jgi:hypothetical protein
MEFCRTEIAELPEVQKFLCRAFGVTADAPFLRTDHLRWKYFDERTDWPGTRSFVLKLDEMIAAHAGVCPITLLTANGPEACFVVIDWAADRNMPGAGLLMSHELCAQFGVRISIGSNEAARLVQRAGHVFEEMYAEIAVFERIVRPFGRALASVSALWKDPLRRVNKLARQVAASAPSTDDWKATRVVAFGDEMLPILRCPPVTVFTPCLRSPELLNYMLRCPASAVAGYQIAYKGTLRGHFLLAEVGGEARIADLSINSDQLEEWAACYALAAEVVESDHLMSHSVSAAGCPQFVRDALTSAGFQLQKTIPVLVANARPLPPQSISPHFNLMDWDAAYLES